MPTTITPNMGLIVPTVSQEPGPQWATDINASLGILDQHNHSSGQGVQITPAGININTDLPLNSNNLTLINTLSFNNLGSPLSGISPNIGVVYEAANELYFNDGAGNQVQLTKSGAVNATSSGISSGTASASFSGGVLVVDANTNTPANIQVASVLLGNNVMNSNFLTLQPPNAMASSFSETLPPSNTSGSTVFLTYDTSNNMGLGPATATISPSGSIVMYGGAAAPSGYLLCDGTSYLRATYPALFGAVGTAYGAADGSHFNVPDFRGIFPRGVNGSASNDPDASSRTAQNTGGNSGNNVGSLQTSDFLSHVHNQTYVSGGPGFGNASVAGSIQQTAANSTLAIGGNETRPINLYVNFIIKT